MKIIPFTKDQWATRWDAVESFLLDDLGVNDQAALASMRFDTPFIAFDKECIVGYANLDPVHRTLELYTRIPAVAEALATQMKSVHPSCRVRLAYTVSGGPKPFKSLNRYQCLINFFAGRWCEFI